MINIKAYTINTRVDKNIYVRSSKHKYQKQII